MNPSIIHPSTPVYLIFANEKILKDIIRCYFNNILQLEQLESELAADRESLHSTESLSTDLMKEKALLEKTLEMLRENSERQVDRNLSMKQMIMLNKTMTYL